MTLELSRLIMTVITVGQTILFIFVLWIVCMGLPRKTTRKAKKVAFNDKTLYNTVNTLLEYCVQKKDNEGAMLITAFGKHLYDKKLPK